MVSETCLSVSAIFCATTHWQRHVTRRAKATVVGACVAAESGQPDLLVIRRVSGLPAAALKVGGVDAATATVPYFTVGGGLVQVKTVTVA